MHLNGGKLLKCYLKGKASKKLANGQNIDYSEKKKENGPRASSAPALGLNTIIFKHVYWYMQQTQVSVYRTIGPLVNFPMRRLICRVVLMTIHFIKVTLFVPCR